MAASPDPTVPPRPAYERSRSRYVLNPPRPWVVCGLLTVLVVVLGALAWIPAGGPSPLVEGTILVFALPTVVAALGTPAVAAAFGGRFSLRRSLFLAFMVGAIEVPLLTGWRLLALAPPFAASELPIVLLLLQGPTLWFRQMSLFGVSRPNHGRSLPPALLQPILAVAGIAILYGVSTTLLIATAAFLLLGFGCALLLLRAADRPLRREFQMSGVALIRPLLDHVNSRDPGATAEIEAFFARHAQPANLRLSLLHFRSATGPVATVVLPTVHPGPFAALGASDLPSKLGVALGHAAGVALVPHTPCNHDQDLPTGAEVKRIADAAVATLAAVAPAGGSDRSSLLFEPHPGAIAKAQVIGGVVLVVVSQAPQPTDDIDLSVADQLRREFEGGPPIALVDAHNSYIEGVGDIVYGTPIAATMLSDARAAIVGAIAAARPGLIEVGAAIRDGYSIGDQGIGPHGIRALVVRAAGRTTAYVLIDGNNLVQGRREPILRAIRSVVDDGEVMTTDNHVVHEVDGGINPVGERYPEDRLAADARTTVQAAVGVLAPVEVTFGSADVPSVRVLGPGWTARLLTSLGDTISMFTNALLTTFLLLVAGSLVVLLAFR